MLKEPDPGPNYAKLMDEYSSKVGARLPAKIIIIPEEPDKEYKAGDAANVEKKKLNNLEVVQQAHYYFNIFKGLIVDLIFSFHERDESRYFFENLLPEDSLRVIEVELNFIYEVFYTKIQVVHSVTGYIMRFMSFGFLVPAFLLFNFKVKKHNYDKFDVRITYILFWGAIGLDTLAFFMLVFSDWTFSALRISNNESKLRKKVKSRISSLLSWFLIFKQTKWYECQKHSAEPKHEVLATPFLFRRWSGYVSGHNLIRYCIKGRPNRTSKQIDNANNCFISDEISNVSTTKRPNRIPFLGQIGGKVIHFLGFIRDKIVHCLGLDSMGGITDFVDEIKYVSHEPLTKELWKFIFNELSRKLDRSSSEPEAAKKISSARGILKLKKMEEHKQEILQLLRDESNSLVILAGMEMGTASWMARLIIECATSTSIDGFCTESLWMSLTKNYDMKSLYKAIYDQLSSGSIPEEWEYEDNNSQLDKTAQGLKVNTVNWEQEEENQNAKQETKEETTDNLKLKIQAQLDKRKPVLLVLDCEGNVMDDIEFKQNVLPVLSSINHRHLKIIINRCVTEGGDAIQEQIELEPLSPDDSLSLLKERVGEQRVSKIPNFNIQFFDAIKEKTRIHCPAAITVVAGSFNDISGYDTLKSALQKAIYYEKPCQDGVNPLLYYAYDMMQSNVTKKCFWHSLQFVRNYGGVHYNELITHWIMEGYFDPFDHIEKAYQVGHLVLMELIDRAMLKM
ncbi:hypothetical protein LWI29_029074 [Acer saccharum]|uniref:DUF4220 domain-containing protein n=1 Tax=Acer saccharum TaxID=4024 RepID=A0AA39T444_ACESA|nr:hypothetical protein LWI29_029074 [Acer saccharum]